MMDEEAGLISVGLSFGGVPSTLVIPLGAVIAFADPHVRFGMRFRRATNRPKPPKNRRSHRPSRQPAEAASTAGATPQVVSLEAFRRRPTKG